MSFQNYMQYRLAMSVIHIWIFIILAFSPQKYLIGSSVMLYGNHLTFLFQLLYRIVVPTIVSCAIHSSVPFLTVYQSILISDKPIQRTSLTALIVYILSIPYHHHRCLISCNEFIHGTGHGYCKQMNIAVEILNIPFPSYFQLIFSYF